MCLMKESVVQFYQVSNYVVSAANEKTPKTNKSL